MAFILITWCFYLVPAAVLSAPLWYFGRHRVRWTIVDVAVLVVPFAVWVLLMDTNWMPKSLANLGEAVLVGLCVPVQPVFRLAAGSRFGEFRSALWGVALVTAAAVVVFFLTPCLPE